MTRVLAISGSLRATSLNSALLRVVAEVAPSEMTVSVYASLGTLPLFNPDIEATDPVAVAHLRNQIIAADALIVATPEYAHGVTGALKNALDWMVGNESFVDKPVALYNASPQSTYATASLEEIVRTMSARIIESASLTVAVRGYHRSAAEIARDTNIVTAVQRSLQALQWAIPNEPRTR